ncbi:MAG: hypothetical protein ACBR12_22780 [Microcoleus sp.]
MSLNYLLDENVDPSYKAEILTRNPDLIMSISHNTRQTPGFSEISGLELKQRSQRI